MELFAEKQRQELYGENRNRHGIQLRDKLTESHILRDGEFNINKKSEKPGFQWSTVTLDDYRRTFQAREQGKQYDEGYKQATGSDIPIKHEGIPVDTYRQTSMKEAYINKGTSEKRSYIGNDPTTNWPDMTPKLIQGKKLGHSEYKDLYIPTDAELRRPHYAKISTSKVQLPLPLDERKHKINVSLGSSYQPMGGHASEANSRYLQTYPKTMDGTLIRQMKEEMEWNSKVFQPGDYNSKDVVKETMFDTDYGKKPKPVTNTNLPKSVEESEQQLSDAIQDKLHFMPSLIEDSMKSDTARKDGEDGKKYHIGAHFDLGCHADQPMSVYYKDYIPFRAQMKPDRVKPVDARVISDNVAVSSYKTSNKEDYYGTNGATISMDNMAIRKTNMQKQNGKSINFVNSSDTTRMQSVFTKDYQGPPKDYKKMDPATEKKCEFNFLESNGMLPQHKYKLMDITENKDNFRGGMGASHLILNGDKARVKSAAKRRLKSGRRAHFSLGTNQPSYKTVSADTFMGKPRDDENIPAAGKVEKPSKDFPHFAMSDNTEDMVADPHAPTLQESRTAIDNYAVRRRDYERLGQSSTIMRSDFLPLEERAYTEPQLRQIKAEAVKAGKSTAKTHFFHTDTSNRNNYETTAMASFIKPEQMSGKVHLSSLN